MQIAFQPLVEGVSETLAVLLASGEVRGQLFLSRFKYAFVDRSASLWIKEEQLAFVLDLLRDAVEREAVLEDVRQAVGVVLEERLERRGVAQQVAEVTPAEAMRLAFQIERLLNLRFGLGCRRIHGGYSTLFRSTRNAQRTTSESFISHIRCVLRVVRCAPLVDEKHFRAGQQRIEYPRACPRAMSRTCC